MEINNTRIDNSLLVSNGTSLDSFNQDKVESNGNFKDAAKIDITEQNVRNAEKRELLDSTQKFLENNGVNLAQESASFDKQNILAVAGSYTAAQGHANAVATRALLS